MTALTKTVNTGHREYYVYNAGGQRIRKVTEDADGNILSDKRYLGSLEVKRNGAGQVQEQTLRLGNNGHAAVTVRKPTDKPYELRYQLGNHLGSVALELDENAEILSYEEYLPYGGTAFIASSDQEQAASKEYRYSDKERDDHSGLCYYGARYYAPWMGRWLNPDPAGTVDGLNLYAFVNGSPITVIDVDGRNGEKANEVSNVQNVSNRRRPKPSSLGEGMLRMLSPQAKALLVKDRQHKHAQNKLGEDPMDLLLPSLSQGKYKEQKSAVTKTKEYTFEVLTGGIAGGLEKGLVDNFYPQGALRAAVKPHVPAGKKRALIGLTGEALDSVSASTGVVSSIDPVISPALAGAAATLKNYSSEASKSKALAIGLTKGTVSGVEGLTPYSSFVSKAGLARNVIEAPKNYPPHLQTLGFRRNDEYRENQRQKAAHLYNMTNELLDEMEKSILTKTSPGFLRSKEGREVALSIDDSKKFLRRQRKKTFERTGFTVADV